MFLFKQNNIIVLTVYIIISTAMRITLQAWNKKPFKPIKSSTTLYNFLVHVHFALVTISNNSTSQKMIWPKGLQAKSSWWVLDQFNNVRLVVVHAEYTQQVITEQDSQWLTVNLDLCLKTSGIFLNPFIWTSIYFKTPIMVKQVHSLRIWNRKQEVKIIN